MNKVFFLKGRDIVRLFFYKDQYSVIKDNGNLMILEAGKAD